MEYIKTTNRLQTLKLFQLAEFCFHQQHLLDDRANAFQYHVLFIAIQDQIHSMRMHAKVFAMQKLAKIHLNLWLC